MHRIRVMIGEMSPMLSSLVTVLFADVGGIELVGRQPHVPLPETVAENRVDVLLLRAGSVVECEAWLGDIARAAPIGIVAISKSGRSGIAYRLDRAPIAASAEGRLDLVGAIALAAGRPVEAHS